MAKVSVLSELRRELEAAGGRLEEEGAVPLEPAEPGGAPELVVPADGLDDLPDRLRDSPTARQVYPDSELGLSGLDRATSTAAG